MCIARCWPLLIGLAVTPVLADQDSAIQRGREHLERRPFNPAIWTEKAYQNVWKQWGLSEKPADLDRAVQERYGLHPAPYDNEGKPLGLLPVQGPFGKGITQTCLLCHAGTLFGQTVMGLGNTSIDLEGLMDDLLRADGWPRALVLPIQVSSVRGTVDPLTPVTHLMQMRDADLNLQKPIDLGRPAPVSSRPPSWWLMKKKRTRDWTGGIDARSDRVDMVFLLSPVNSAATIKKFQPIFADVRQFVHSIEPPRYPFPIDTVRAARGRDLFTENCSRCHGTYGPGASYPSKIVPLKTIGTDPTLAQGMNPRLLEHLNQSWFAQERSPDGQRYQLVDTGGYQAPPLDGVWATAPYFHNASVPTLYHVLNSKARPTFFTRSYRTDREDYDSVQVGWNFRALTGPADQQLPAHERRKTYDTTQPGLGNGGHPFGDKLSEDDRWAVIEYLKTL